MTTTMTEREAARAGIGGKKKAPAHRPGEMNKTETEYSWILEKLKLIGQIAEWRFEKVTLKLGPDLRYTPDFFVVRQLASGRCIEFHEVKGGFIRDDASVKIRAAAEQFKCFCFYLAQKKKGIWTVKEI